MAIIPIIIANTLNASPRGESYTSISGDSKWPDLSFSQKITGDIKTKIEIIIRSICDAMQFSTMTYKEQDQLIADSFVMSAI